MRWGDGTDPAAQALHRLTAPTGAPAGQLTEGPSTRTVSSRNFRVPCRMSQSHGLTLVGHFERGGCDLPLNCGTIAGPFPGPMPGPRPGMPMPDMGGGMGGMPQVSLYSCISDVASSDLHSSKPVHSPHFFYAGLSWPWPAAQAGSKSLQKPIVAIQLVLLQTGSSCLGRIL